MGPHGISRDAAGPRGTSLGMQRDAAGPRGASRAIPWEFQALDSPLGAPQESRREHNRGMSHVPPRGLPLDDVYMVISKTLDYWP